MIFLKTLNLNETQKYVLFELIFKIYEKFGKHILDMYSPYTNRALKVSNRLFQANKDMEEVSSIKWRLTVIDADVINAAAFPVNSIKSINSFQKLFILVVLKSGELVVFTGLLDFVENDDELAIILAHEMSHAILQHAVNFLK